MRELTFPEPAVGGQSYSPTSPTQNTENASRYLLDLFSALHAAGFVLRQDEDSDYTAYSTELSSWIAGDFNAWRDAVESDLQDDPPTVPDQDSIPISSPLKAGLNSQALNLLAVQLSAQVAIKDPQISLFGGLHISKAGDYTLIVDELERIGIKSSNPEILNSAYYLWRIWLNLQDINGNIETLRQMTETSPDSGESIFEWLRMAGIRIEVGYEKTHTYLTSTAICE